jgi:hypothetical protein
MGKESGLMFDLLLLWSLITPYGTDDYSRCGTLRVSGGSDL